MPGGDALALLLARFYLAVPYRLAKKRKLMSKVPAGTRCEELRCFAERGPSVWRWLWLE